MTTDDPAPPSYEDLMKDQYRTTFWVENDSDRPMHLFMEPWGTVFDVPPRGFVRIEAIGPKTGGPVFWGNRDDKDLVYSAWAGSRYAVYQDEQLISWSLDECPPEPSGIHPLTTSAVNIRKFLHGE